MNKVVLFLSVAIFLTGCGSATEPAATTTAAPPATAPAPVPDHTSLFPVAGQISKEVVPDHILGMKALPGGSIADYNVKGKKYQMFIVDGGDNQKAAFMMLDMKAELQPNPQYLSYMGGYFGTFGDKPFYCFAKLHYLAGIVGLTKEQADPLAISLAAQLN